MVLAYNLTILVRTEWTVFQKNQNNATSVLLFKKAFDNDINECNYIKNDGNKKYYLVFNNDTIQYSFAGQIIRSQNNSRDTFEISIPKIHCTYITGAEDVVSSISLYIKQPIEIKSAIFSKNYSSEQLMNIPQNRSL